MGHGCKEDGGDKEIVDRDGNLNPTRGYPAWPDPNGPDFTRSDKE